MFSLRITKSFIEKTKKSRKLQKVTCFDLNGLTLMLRNIDEV